MNLLWIFGSSSILLFEVLKNQMEFQYLLDGFKYFLTRSLCPKMKLKFKPLSSYFGDGAMKSQEYIVVIASDGLPSPHQSYPPPLSDVGEHVHTSLQLSHPPTISTINF